MNTYPNRNKYLLIHHALDTSSMGGVIISRLPLPPDQPSSRSPPVVWVTPRFSMSPPPHNPCIPLYSTPQVPIGNLGPISDHAPPTSNDTTASQSTPPREPLDLPPLIHHSSSPRPLNTNDPPLQAGFHDPMFTLQASTQRPHLGPRHRATRHGTRPHQPPRGSTTQDPMQVLTTP